MPQRWIVGFAMDGDLRFLSHHDCMRVVERVACRAGLPLRYSQGYNPRPAVSLLLPRPVGVAAADELLLLGLEAPMSPEDLLACLNRHAPRGMRFHHARPSAGKPPRPLRATYELAAGATVPPDLAGRLGALRRAPSWPVERTVSGPDGRRDRTRRIDLKPLVEDIDLNEGRLRFTLRRGGDAWARPGEVLALLGLDARADLAGLVRTGIQCEPERAAEQGPRAQNDLPEQGQREP